MADVPDPGADSAEKAYAEAVADAKPAEAKAPKVEGPQAAPAPVEPKPAVAKTSKAPAKKRAAKSRTARPPGKPAGIAKPAAKAARVRKPGLRKHATPMTFAGTPTVSELKEKIMANAKTDEFSKPITEAIGEFQSRARVAYEKGAEAMAEATEFAKGNVEALVESGKILAGGAQEFGKAYVEEARTAYEALTADLKELAAAKSPTELFQLQSRIARRNFDALVATGSKNTEAAMKLASEAFAPLSGRVNAAAEKLNKVA